MLKFKNNSTLCCLGIIVGHVINLTIIKNNQNENTNYSSTILIYHDGI